MAKSSDRDAAREEMIQSIAAYMEATHASEAVVTVPAAGGCRMEVAVRMVPTDSLGIPR